MSLLELESFDGLDETSFFTKWSHGWNNYNVVATFPAGRTNNCLKILSTSGSTTSGILLPINALESDTVVVGFAYKQTSWTATGHTQFALNGVGGYHFDMYGEAASPIKLFRTAGVSREIKVANFSTWRYVEIKLFAHNTTGTCQVKIDRELIVDFTGDTLGTAGRIAGFYLGTKESSANPYYVDDLYILNTAGSANNDFLGPIKIETLYPNGNGTTNNFTGSDADSTDNYLLVDDDPPDTADYVETLTVSDLDLYNYTPLTTTNIEAVVGIRVESYIKLAESGLKGFKHSILSNTIPLDSAEMFHTNEDHKLFSTIHEQNPDGPATWTVSAVNLAEFGLKVTS